MFESHLVRHWNSYPIEKSDGFSYCNNIWAKLEIIWNRITKLFRWNMKEIRWSSNIKISRKATESELSKLMMVRVAFCSALVFCYLVNKSLKISLECAPPVINFQREERTKANVTLILQCWVISSQHFFDNRIWIVKGTKVALIWYLFENLWQEARILMRFSNFCLQGNKRLMSHKTPL